MPLVEDRANVAADTAMIAGEIPSIDTDVEHCMRDTPYTLEMPVYSDDGRAFGAVTNRRVLIYWPHGFGDFVHLSFVVPLLDPSQSILSPGLVTISCTSTTAANACCPSFQAPACSAAGRSRVRGRTSDSTSIIHPRYPL